MWLWTVALDFGQPTGYHPLVEAMLDTAQGSRREFGHYGCRGLKAKGSFEHVRGVVCRRSTGKLPAPHLMLGSGGAMRTGTAWFLIGATAADPIEIDLDPLPVTFVHMHPPFARAHRAFVPRRFQTLQEIVLENNFGIVTKGN